MFCLSCLNSLTYPMDRSMILGYIKYKKEIKGDLPTLTNQEMYNNLLEIMNEMGIEKVKIETKKRIPKKIVVD